VLSRVNLRCDSGIVVLVGPNGCGKSTLLRIVAGVLAPDEGQVRIRNRSLPAALRDVGYVPEGADPPPHLTVREVAALAGALRRGAAASGTMDALVDRLGVRPFLDQRVGSLSLGQRRRACLLAALIGDPWLLVLDEPDNGLDVGGQAMLAALLRERTGAAIVATHDQAFTSAITSQDSGARLFQL
jgi:ABC-type multidrug transport system ATPase subunit